MHLLLKWSIAALLAGNGADAVSSWGRPEMNPVLGQQFGMRSTAIKFGVIGGVVVGEAIMLRHHPEMRKPFVMGNFMMAGAMAGAAIHNKVTE